MGNCVKTKCQKPKQSDQLDVPKTAGHRIVTLDYHWHPPYRDTNVQVLELHHDDQRKTFCTRLLQQEEHFEQSEISLVLQLCEL